MAGASGGRRRGHRGRQPGDLEAAEHDQLRLSCWGAEAGYRQTLGGHLLAAHRLAALADPLGCRNLHTELDEGLVPRAVSAAGGGGVNL